MRLLIRTKILTIVLVLALPSAAQLFGNLETGAIAVDRNDIRKGRDGTLFSLSSDFQNAVSPFLRIRVGCVVDDKHYFSLLYAPLKIETTGTLGTDIIYGGETFVANSPIDVVYKFNSYRFTYARRIVNSEKLIVRLGFSAKIRDAGISLKNKDIMEEDFSIGFVPLLHLASDYKLGEKVGISLLGDAIVASNGRAIDVAVTGSYDFSDNLQSSVGYRLLEGGADGANRYNFVQVHFAVLGLTYQF